MICCERLSRCPTTPCNSRHSRTTNIWEEPPLEGHPTTGWEPVSPPRFRTGSFRGESIVVSAAARRGVVSASGQQRDHDMKARPRERGEQPHLIGPFHAGGAKRDAVFYTPHSEGWCRRTHRGGATCQNRNLYPVPPQKRVYRGSTQEVPK